MTASAGAAGLGRLTVQSALGQPLQAEVEITALNRDEAASVTVRVPAPDAFRQAGLPYNPVLAGVRVAIARRPDGRAVVQITSSSPINEAFIDLLVELNWSSGRLMREYTFLLDPPELRLGKTDAVEAGAALVSARPAAVRAVPAPVATPTPVATPQARPAPAAVPTTTPVPMARPAPARDAAPRILTIKRGDTLAGIAAGVQPKAASLAQTMIALYRANPESFFGSPHQMYAGRTLAVPEAGAVVAIDSAQASRDLRESTREFEAYRARLAQAAREIPAAKTGQAAAGAIVAKPVERPPAAAGDQLKLSRSELSGTAPGPKSGQAGTQVGQPGPQVGQPGPQTGPAAEARVASETAMREMQSRMTDLERSVGDLQKLLELKNRQLADLERQLSDARLAATTAKGSVTPAAVGATPPVAGTGAPTSAPTTAPDVAPAAPMAAAPEAMKPASPVAETPVAPAGAKPAVSSARGFFDQLLDNPLLLPGLGGLALVAAFYAWFIRRRRRPVERFEDSLVAQDAFTANSLFGATGGQSVDTGDSLFATSTRGSGVDVHSTEVDPIAEAEVYIAYGREAQAEEILHEALAKQPERQAIRLKLLEILAGRKDVDGFAALAKEMVATSGGQNEEWPKVVMLGLAIDPENPLYTGRQPADESVGADTVPQSGSSDTQAPGASDAARAGAPAESHAAGALDFDLDPDLDLGDQTTVTRAAARLHEGELTQKSAGPESDLENALEGRIDLPSLELGERKKPAAPKGREEPDAIADLEDFDLDIPSFETLRGPAESEPTLVDLSSIGLDLSPDTVIRSVDGDAERWQEMATKLDLAGAYEEIGDKEGARELLEEVIAGGDSSQQEQAREILARIR